MATHARIAIPFLQQSWLAFTSTAVGMCAKPHFFGLMPKGPLAKPLWAHLLCSNAVLDEGIDDEAEEDDTSLEYIVNHLRVSSKGKSWTAISRSKGSAFGAGHTTCMALAAAVHCHASNMLRSQAWSPDVSTAQGHMAAHS